MRSLALTLFLFLLGCEGEITYRTITCDVTIHVDSLTLAVDSITFTPPEYAEVCRAAWEMKHGPM